MKVSGSTTLQAPRHEVWRALNDPGVLVQTIPGCQRLEALGQYSYKMTVSAGVGSIKGVYDGEVHLTEHQEPGSFLMRAQGAGAPGTIGAAVQVTLVESAEGGTELTYDADATVGGMIGGVGQRMLTGVSKKLAAEFFDNVDALLAAGVAAGLAVPGPGAPTIQLPSFVGQPPGPSTVGAPAPGPAHAAAPPLPGQPLGGGATPGPAFAAAAPPSGQSLGGGVSAPVGTVFTPPAGVAPAGGPAGAPGFVLGVVVGAVAALAGAVVGGWLTGRRHDAR
ncbi:carbon monoxide dehydrogenase subunit G [Nocardioides sp. WL0053]|uniref:Carbon monoxide dehydrogenase subunit G n=1 Tax=Nocardioides jiangsuensis TaxID=2866161 RepID=A0ABS7RRQ1_9ACTN|nr:carbon monoxide dehydrogenase subunit G [Nocardioides jiangsuensis]MBY9076267.1 carbon monoxide dehydrogenase subunit G [Nocardioides jiangsuensis]